jgi:hypothetical protein
MEFLMVKMVDDLGGMQWWNVDGWKWSNEASIKAIALVLREVRPPINFKQHLGALLLHRFGEGTSQECPGTSRILRETALAKHSFHRILHLWLWESRRSLFCKFHANKKTNREWIYPGSSPDRKSFLVVPFLSVHWPRSCATVRRRRGFGVSGSSWQGLGVALVDEDSQVWNSELVFSHWVNTYTTAAPLQVASDLRWYAAFALMEDAKMSTSASSATSGLARSWLRLQQLERPRCLVLIWAAPSASHLSHVPQIFWKSPWFHQLHPPKQNQPTNKPTIFPDWMTSSLRLHQAHSIAPPPFQKSTVWLWETDGFHLETKVFLQTDFGRLMDSTWKPESSYKLTLGDWWIPLGNQSPQTSPVRDWCIPFGTQSPSTNMLRPGNHGRQFRESKRNEKSIHIHIHIHVHIHIHIHINIHIYIYLMRELSFGLWMSALDLESHAYPQRVIIPTDQQPRASFIHSFIHSSNHAFIHSFIQAWYSGKGM